MIELGVVVSACTFTLVTGLVSVETVRGFLLLAVPGIVLMKIVTKV